MMIQFIARAVCIVCLALLIPSASAQNQISQMNIVFESGWRARVNSDKFSICYGSNPAFYAKAEFRQIQPDQFFEFLELKIDDRLDYPPLESLYVVTRGLDPNQIGYYSVPEPQRAHFLVSQWSANWVHLSKATFEDIIEKNPIFPEWSSDQIDFDKELYQDFERIFTNLSDSKANQERPRTLETIRSNNLASTQSVVQIKQSPVQETTAEAPEHPTSFPWLWKGAIAVIAGVVAFLVFQRRRA